MALQKTNDKSVVPITAGQNESGNATKKKQKVLDEETYTQNVEDIIQRDFFPDLPSLKEQTDYFTALETNDLVKLREIQMRAIDRRPTTALGRQTDTPESFETPDPLRRQHSPQPYQQPNDLDGGLDKGESTTKQKGEKKLQSLDKYLANNTSEDNASFSEILEETRKQRREKHAWLFENEGIRKLEEEERLALPSAEEQCADTERRAGLDTWKYKTRNSLMYVPEGEDFSGKEIIELQKAKRREVVHENTRFQRKPWNQMKSKEQIKQAASMKMFASQGKIGHDGKEVIVPESPSVNGYGFVATPSPAPGVEESPLMTWGELEGTPLRLEGSDTPAVQSSGPSFRIPEVPKRDRIGLELAEKASKAHRDKKEKALKSVQARLATPSPSFRRSTTERLNSMSPAAQRLARLRTGKNTDSALRASYTPSPTQRLPGSKTPSMSPLLTPKSGNNTPSGARTPNTPGSKRLSDSVSITDNLLQLPKRKKASDFF